MGKMPFQFEVGDVLACHGNDWISWGIELGTMVTTGPWFPPRLPPSHVAIVCEYKGQRVLAESTSLCRRPCMILKKAHGGVQLQEPWPRVLEDYEGNVEVWRLLPKYALRSHESYDLSTFLLECVDDHEDYDLYRAILSGGRWSRGWLAPNPRKAFCSQLAYAALEWIHRLPIDNAAAYNPAALVKALEYYGKARQVVRRFDMDGQPVWTQGEDHPPCALQFSR